MFPIPQSYRSAGSGHQGFPPNYPIQANRSHYSHEWQSNSKNDPLLPDGRWCIFAKRTNEANWKSTSKLFQFHHNNFNHLLKTDRTGAHTAGMVSLSSKLTCELTRRKTTASQGKAANCNKLLPLRHLSLMSHVLCATCRSCRTCHFAHRTFHTPENT